MMINSANKRFATPELLHFGYYQGCNYTYLQYLFISTTQGWNISSLLKEDVILAHFTGSDKESLERSTGIVFSLLDKNDFSLKK